MIDTFNTADWILLGILLVSSLISLKRGFVKEALSLVIWVLAVGVALIFAPQLDTVLAEYIPVESLRPKVGFALLFVAVLIVGSLVSKLIGQLIKMTGLSGTDRLLGVVFGFFRGVVLLLAAFVLLPKWLPIQEDTWYKESVVIPHIMSLEAWGTQTATELREWLLGIDTSQLAEKIVKKEV